MTDIKQIPTDELVADLNETLADIERCQLAVDAGHTHYAGGNILARRDINLEIRDKIRNELSRRASEHLLSSAADVGCEHCNHTGEEWIAVSGGHKWTGEPCPYCGGAVNAP